MDKCKFCHQELAEDSTVCPHCGKDNAEEKENTEALKETAQEAKAPEQVPEDHKQETESTAGDASGENTGEVSEEAEEAAGEAPEKKADAEEKPEEKPEEASAQEKADFEKAAAQAEKQETAKEKKPAKPGQIALAVLVVVALAALLVALIVAALNQKTPDGETAPAETTLAVTEPAETTEPTIPADGNPDDATCKGTYTAEEEELKAAASEVVAKMAEFQLTNSELQIYYWKGIQAFLESNPYAPYLVDMNQPLDSQHCAVAEGLTWQQFFLREALRSWQNYQAMAAEAEANDMEPSQEIKDFLRSLSHDIEEQAKENGFKDGAEMLAANVGPGSSVSDYVHFMETYQTGMGFYVHFLQVAEPDDEEMETYYNENQTVLEEGGITKDAKAVDVRHVLITPEDEASDDSWQEAEKKANDLLEGFRSGEESEDAFAALATEHTQDPGSKETGGLYQHVVLGQMVPEFEQWCFDDRRLPGDTGVVKTSYGYHIMYYVDDQPIWKEQVANVILNEKSNDLIERNAKTYPMTVDYSKILLGLPTTPDSVG